MYAENPGNLSWLGNRARKDINVKYLQDYAERQQAYNLGGNVKSKWEARSFLRVLCLSAYTNNNI